MECVGVMSQHYGGLENTSHSHWELINYYQEKNQTGKANKLLRTESKDDE